MARDPSDPLESKAARRFVIPYMPIAAAKVNTGERQSNTPGAAPAGHAYHSIKHAARFRAIPGAKLHHRFGVVVPRAGDLGVWAGFGGSGCLGLAAGPADAGAPGGPAGSTCFCVSRVQTIRIRS